MEAVLARRGVAITPDMGMGAPDANRWLFFQERESTPRFHFENGA